MARFRYTYLTRAPNGPDLATWEVGLPEWLSEVLVKNPHETRLGLLVLYTVPT